MRSQSAIAKTAADAATSAAVTAASGLSDNRDYFVKTLEQMKGQTDASKEAAVAAKNSAASSEQQAGAATKSNELIEQTRLDSIAAFKQENRAQLRHGQLMLSEPDDKGTIQLRFPMTNDRPTDATNIRIRVLVAVGPVTHHLDCRKLCGTRMPATKPSRPYSLVSKGETSTPQWDWIRQW